MTDEEAERKLAESTKYPIARTTKIMLFKVQREKYSMSAEEAMKFVDKCVLSDDEIDSKQNDPLL